MNSDYFGQQCFSNTFQNKHDTGARCVRSARERYDVVKVVHYVSIKEEITKAVTVNGSPRKGGNTELLLQKVIELIAAA